MATDAICCCAFVLLSACGGDDGDTSDSDIGPDALQVAYADPGSRTAFTGLSASSSSLQMSFAGVAEEHSVEVGANSTADGDATSSVDLTTLQNAFQIVPDASPQSGGFIISHTTKDDETFDTFTDFMSALSTDMTPPAMVADVAATGSYDSSSTTFTAKTLAIMLND